LPNIEGDSVLKTTANAMADPQSAKGERTRFRLAIVGASARAAAMSAIRAGFDVAAADLFADADLQQLCHATRIEPYPVALRDWLARTECDGWMYVGALENHADLVQQMTKQRALLGNSAEVLRAVRDPLRLRRVFAESGLNFPETHPAAGPAPRDGCWLAKTYRGSSGVGVAVGRPSVEHSGAYFWQRHVEGLNASAVFVGNGAGAECMGVSTQLVGESWNGAAPFQYCGSIAPFVASEPVTQSIDRLGAVLAASFQLIGVFGVDLLIDDQLVWALEVNPRYTASMELFERLGRGSVIEAHASACTRHASIKYNEQKRVAMNRSREFVGKAILFADRACQITECATKTLLAEAGRRSPPNVADIPIPGTTIEPGQPMLTVFADGGTHDEVYSQLRAQLEHCRRVLYDAP